MNELNKLIYDFIKINDNKLKHKPVTGIYLIINKINNKEYIGDEYVN